MKELIQRIDELYAKATLGPWCVESCGEKGDGCNVIGVAFAPDDINAERPLSGWLDPYDSEGNEIEYYRDEEIATLEHRDRNPGHNANLIMALHNAWPLLRDALERMQKDAWIPVSERLPEVNAPVALIDVQRWENCPHTRHFQDVGYLSEAGGQSYWSIRGGRACDVRAYSHWQPLHEPPALDKVKPQEVE